MTNEDNWQVKESDEELYNPGKCVPKVWEPLPEDIVELYTKLSEEEKSLPLSWKMPGRRSPEMENMECGHTEEQKEDAEQEEKPSVPTEFDFDDASDVKQITPRRTPASIKTPKSQKRVASMDKIMGDLFRNKKEQSSTPSRQGTKIKIRQIPMS